MFLQTFLFGLCVRLGGVGLGELEVEVGVRTAWELGMRVTG